MPAWLSGKSGIIWRTELMLSGSRSKAAVAGYSKHLSCLGMSLVLNTSIKSITEFLFRQRLFRISRLEEYENCAEF
jgi:hypothetical protein